MMQIPPYLHTRATVVLLFSPFVAGAMSGVMGKKVLLYLLRAEPFQPGDVTIGLPFGAVALAVLLAISTRSVQVWRGASSQFNAVFRAAPIIGLVGLVLGLLANRGR